MTAVVERDEVHIGQLVMILEDAGAITPVKLDLSGLADMTFDQYEAIGAFAGRVNRSSRWWVGDWIIAGEALFGEQMAQALTYTGLSEQTLLDYAFVCRSVPADRRREALSFGCHKLVARKDAKEQVYWLNQAEKGGWSTPELAERMRAKRREERPPLLDPPEDDKVDLKLLEEAGRAILRDYEETDDARYVRIPLETFRRLEAAFGD